MVTIGLPIVAYQELKEAVLPSKSVRAELPDGSHVDGKLSPEGRSAGQPPEDRQEIALDVSGVENPAQSKSSATTAEPTSATAGEQPFHKPPGIITRLRDK
jgi:hypothetical protein